ncbi:hypothetical protein HBI56_050080 [Parastagonospora nodorum]|uniref:Uncharacterized protein n=1 Tax=Phaeosphaeria nodorum (strain SN15 / ATCC MYA-4574 / FGSC 10173) TaxID=321614 RepID=A0A7U2ESQ3_PHANO|nr:hypothetical protein HBH56_063010 [Parastagonospora nodorum]QRC92106.1 hypothetical protein JI435_022710 [Parastagonospora nodorum SN15]KAH3930798.1 hypothetical protein HBH54_106950 [Parastagonospora nodorum]KAH3954017.1 hypothetical protein HBH53_021890 [Parastagonospora nodorum]KAH3968240.1 hypothetical protein HBH51_131780 [Parastagonospora nodorum]
MPQAIDHYYRHVSANVGMLDAYSPVSSPCPFIVPTQARDSNNHPMHTINRHYNCVTIQYTPTSSVILLSRPTKPRNPVAQLLQIQTCHFPRHPTAIQHDRVTVPRTHRPAWVSALSYSILVMCAAADAAALGGGRVGYCIQTGASGVSGPDIYRWVGYDTRDAIAFVHCRESKTIGGQGCDVTLSEVDAAKGRDLETKAGLSWDHPLRSALSFACLGIVDHHLAHVLEQSLALPHAIPAKRRSLCGQLGDRRA